MTGRRRWAAALALLPLLAGCDTFWGGGDDSGPDCAWMSESDGPAPADAVALLVDRSSSTRAASSGAGQPDYLTALAGAVHDAVDTGAAVWIGGFDGSAGSVTWSARGLRTNPPDKNPQNRDDRKVAAAGCLTDALRTAVAGPALQPQTDVLGGISQAGTEIAGAAASRTLIVATDGVPTVGCAGLAKAAIGDRAEITPIVDSCSGEMPASVKGFHVEFVGVGHPAGDRPQPPTLALAWLRQLWQGLCARMTGQATLCSVSTAMPGDGRPRTPRPTPAGAGPADAAVTFPGPGVPVSTRGGDVWELPADTLFATARWDLSREGEAALLRLAVRLRAYGRADLTVTGHTDSRGGTQYNQELGRKRARAVAVFLAAHGLPAASVVSRGEKEPACFPDTGPDGSYLESALRCNRRVEILVHRSRV